MGSWLIAYCAALFVWVGASEVAARIRLPPYSLVAAEGACAGAYFVAHIAELLPDLVGDMPFKPDAAAGCHFASGGRRAFKMLGEDESDGQIRPPTRDEARRVQQHVAVPQIAYHYRYTAIQYAWRAAELMPDNSEETARVLCIAGSWMKGRDPNEADRFYKELVIRCAKTKLGQEADKLRWFPKIDMDREKLLEQTK